MLGHKKISNRGGFSLVELMIVLVIVGILAAISLMSYSKAVKKAKLSEAKLALKQIWECNEMFYNETGHYYGPAFDIGDSGLPAIGFSPLSGHPLFIYSIVLSGLPVYVAEPLGREYGGDVTLEGYEVLLDSDGQMFVFEPGVMSVDGRNRLSPTGGIR